MSKKVSAAVIILDPITNSILCCHATGNKFAEPDGTASLGVWGLLKGEVDEDEDDIEAAIREVYEESGIKLEKEKVKHVGHFYYTPEKDLEVFYYIDTDHIDHTTLKCNSYFEKDGQLLPEDDAYAWLNWPEDKKYFSLRQQKVIEKAMKKIEAEYIEDTEKEINDIGGELLLDPEVFEESLTKRPHSLREIMKLSRKELDNLPPSIYNIRDDCKKIHLKQHNMDKILETYRKLDEQKINQLNKIYYHGSPLELKELKPQSNFSDVNHKHGCIFLTPSYEFAKQFVNKFRKEDKVYIYHCKLKSKHLNLFNMNYAKDWDRLDQMLKKLKIKEPPELEKLYDMLYKKEYKSGGEGLWFEFEASILPDLCYLAGFDGFSNRGDLTEETLSRDTSYADFVPANNFALFDPYKIEIIQVDIIGEKYNRKINEHRI